MSQFEGYNNQPCNCLWPLNPLSFLPPTTMGEALAQTYLKIWSVKGLLIVPQPVDSTREITMKRPVADSPTWEVQSTGKRRRRCSDHKRTTYFPMYKYIGPILLNHHYSNRGPLVEVTFCYSNRRIRGGGSRTELNPFTRWLVSMYSMYLILFQGSTLFNINRGRGRRVLHGCATPRRGPVRGGAHLSPHLRRTRVDWIGKLCGRL
jgi:hypothetical protein